MDGRVVRVGRDLTLDAREDHLCHLQRLNACKNVLAGSVNAMAAIVFVLTTAVDWKVVVAIAVGSTIGGQIGARYGRRLDPRALRAFIVVVGLVAIVHLL